MVLTNFRTSRWPMVEHEPNQGFSDWTRCRNWWKHLKWWLCRLDNIVSFFIGRYSSPACLHWTLSFPYHWSLFAKVGELCSYFVLWSCMAWQVGGKQIRLIIAHVVLIKHNVWMPPTKWRGSASICSNSLWRIKQTSSLCSWVISYKKCWIFSAAHESGNQAPWNVYFKCTCKL